MILGAHESIAGGLSRAFERAAADKAESLQIFTKNARGWKAKPLADEETAAFRAAAKATGIRAIAHCTYLVNLASDDPAMREKSLDGFTDELSRCGALGIPHLVVHPGSHPDLDRGIELIAQGLSQSLSRANASADVLLEVTAGQGTSIGHRFEHLARILEQVKAPDRVGLCLDTCHLYAAGYDIASEAGYHRTLEELDRAVGLQKVQAFHLNDCKKPLGCRVDRHEEIGQGTLGLKAFAPLVNDPRFKGVVAVVETPEPENYAKNIDALRRLQTAHPPAGRRKPARP